MLTFRQVAHYQTEGTVAIYVSTDEEKDILSIYLQSGQIFVVEAEKDLE